MTLRRKDVPNGGQFVNWRESLTVQLAEWELWSFEQDPDTFCQVRVSGFVYGWEFTRTVTHNALVITFHPWVSETCRDCENEVRAGTLHRSQVEFATELHDPGGKICGRHLAWRSIPIFGVRPDEDLAWVGPWADGFRRLPLGPT